MSNEQDIADIVIQLQRLQLQQSELLQRIVQVSEENNTARPARAPRTAQPSNTRREFVIGNRVRIINPQPSQPPTRTITKIGIVRLTVTADNGTKINRIAKNLVLEE